nr:MAG TPA: hypothetical protein [Caudoviricetes sp.]
MVTLRSPCHFFFFCLNLSLNLCNHFRKLFFTFFSCFCIDILALPLAVRIRRRVLSFIQVVVNHRDTVRPWLAYFWFVRREFDQDGIFPFLTLFYRHTGVCTAACLCMVSLIWL